MESTWKAWKDWKDSCLFLLCISNKMSNIKCQHSKQYVSIPEIVAFEHIFEKTAPKTSNIIQNFAKLYFISVRTRNGSTSTPFILSTCDSLQIVANAGEFCLIYDTVIRLIGFLIIFV